MRYLRRLRCWVHRKLIPILSIIACSALFLSTFAVVRYTQIQSDRQTERKVYDAQSCERGNDLRRKIISIGESDAQLVRDLLDQLLGARVTSDAGADQLAMFLLTLEPSFDKQEAAVDSIEITDCAQALNNAKETP